MNKFNEMNLGQQLQTQFLLGSIYYSTLGPIYSPHSEFSLSKKISSPTKSSYYNQALLLDRKGNAYKRYFKIYAVPFSEYFPFPWMLKFLPFLERWLKEAGSNQFSQGIIDSVKNKKYFFDIANLPFGCLICYEDCFPVLSRHLAKNGALFLSVLSNDSWGKSLQAQNIHYLFSVFRAIENRRFFVRSTNAGVSAIIDDLGKPTLILPFFVKESAVGKVTAKKDITFYTLWGDWVIGVLLVLLVLCSRKNFSVRILSREIS